jgi:hypothetical protein
MLDAHAWVVCKVVVEIMLPFVKQCTFNQTRGYWLLINALNVALSINLCMQIQIQQFNITPFNIVKVDFEFEMGALWVCMMAKVQAVLAPFMAFTYSYNASKVHNMLVFVLDPCFKSLDVVKAFVR